MFRILALTAALLTTLVLTATTVMAQSPVVTAELDRTTATTDDVITLSIVVAGGHQASQPQLPFLDGLVVIGSSSVSQVTITNGRAVSNFLFEYRLAATRTGKITIGPVGIAIDGTEHQTAPLQLDVSQGAGNLAAPTPAPNFDFDPDPSSAPSNLAGQDHFVEAGVDDSNPYLGQQLTYFRKYYVVRDPVRDTFTTRRSSAPPSFDGFWHRDLTDEGRYEVDAAGRRYSVFEERTVLFPTLVGRNTIDPSVTRVSTSPLQPPVELVTQAVRIDVRPLPAGAPDGFEGAVGRYRITASVDSDRLSGGDPATLTVTISGSGNIDALPEPTLPKTDQWRAFSQDSSASSQVFQGVLRGSKTFTFLLLPNTDGVLAVPSIEYVYFDPELETYVTMTTDPIRVEVEPGSIDIVAIQQAIEEVDEGAETALEILVPGELRGLKPVEGTLSTTGKGFTAPAWYWGLFALPVLMLLFIETYRQRRRLGRAFAEVGLSRSKAVSRERVEPAPEPDVRLLDHLSNLLGRPVSGLASDRLALELGRRGAEPGLISDVRRILDAGHEARFAPPELLASRGNGNGEGDEDVRGAGNGEIEKLIRRLDESLQ